MAPFTIPVTKESDVAMGEVLSDIERILFLICLGLNSFQGNVFESPNTLLLISYINITHQIY